MQPDNTARKRIGVRVIHGVGEQTPFEHLETIAGNLFKEIFPIIASAILVLSGCSKGDDCLTKVEPSSAPNEIRTNLGQCWTPDDLVRYYTTNIGTQLVRYNLVMPLKLAVPHKTDPNKLVITDELFFTRSHIEERWRFLALEDFDLDERSDLPPEWKKNQNVVKQDIATGWPAGFTVDQRAFGKEEWRGEWLGPTCAACHTRQIEYTSEDGKKFKIRIPGGPTTADVNLFLQDLKNSLTALHEDGVKGGAEFTRYIERYVDRFGPEDPKKLVEKLKEAVEERTNWHTRNDPPPSLAHGNGRLDAFGEIYNEIIAMTESKPVDVIRTDAPVSIPFLWDFSHHNLVQWNGAAPVVPLAFNVAGALAIFAKYDHKAGWFQDPSTIRLSTLRKLQELLDRLRSPKWPESILGPINTKEADAGRVLFRSKCRICHAVQEREKPLEHTKVAMIKIDENTVIDGEIVPPIQTESKMAENASTRELTDSEGNNKMKVSSKLVSATMDIIFSLSHPVEWVFLVKEGLSALFTWKLELLPKPFDAYKARPLDGIWATAPYLHNGSVPNLYELLLPQAKRTKQFCVGNREFDPKRVGFVMSTEAECKAKNLYWLDTSKEGNRNTGHEGPGYDMKTENQSGFTEKQILELVEYMKTL